MNPTLRQGSRGVEVRQLQQTLGIPADGIFGPQTAAAVRQFQRNQGIGVDAIVGPVTWSKLLSNRAQDTTPTGSSQTGSSSLPPVYPTGSSPLSSSQIRTLEERRRIADKEYQEALAAASRGVPMAQAEALRKRQSEQRSSERSIMSAMEELAGKGLARDPRFAGRTQREAGENLRLKYGEIQSQLGDEMQALEDMVTAAMQRRRITYGLSEADEAEYRTQISRLFPAATQYGVI